jgi:hypothetical protein
MIMTLKDLIVSAAKNLILSAAVGAVGIMTIILDLGNCVRGLRSCVSALLCRAIFGFGCFHED